MRVARVLVCTAGAFVAFASAAAIAESAEPSAPSPAAAVLPVIGRTRATTPLCAMVRDNVAPAVVGLMAVDDLLGAGRSDYRRMADESKTAQNLSRIRLGNAVSGMVHDLSIVRSLVNDEKRFSRAAVTDDDRLALRLRAQLQAVSDRQEAALNMVNGVLETDLLNQMLGGFANTPRFGTSRRFYHAVADALAEQQKKVAQAETELAPTIIAAAAVCGSPQPAPSPVTNASPPP